LKHSPVSVSLTDLIQLASRAGEFSLGARSVRALHAGQHLSRLMGRGMEFAETRRYQPGDDIRTIDWRVTARTGKAHTKLFAVEKERCVHVCVDLRRPMFFATRGVFKSVQAATMAGYIAWNAVHEGNRIGGLIFDDKETVEMKPMRGKKGGLHFLQSLAKVATYNEEQSPQVGRMEGAVSRLCHLVQPGSLVFILSDFRKFSSQMEINLMQITRHSDLVLCMIYDPIEEALPEGYLLPVTNGERELELNTREKKLVQEYHGRFSARKMALEALGRHNHIQFRTCSTQEDVFEELRCWKI
jgi:uncharacterized protein (DUF58 family)